MIAVRCGAALHDGLLNLVRQFDKLQAIAKALATTDHRIDPDFLGAIRKGESQGDGSAQRDGGWYISADSALAHGVAAAEDRNLSAIRLGGGYLQTYVDFVPVPAPLYRIF